MYKTILSTVKREDLVQVAGPLFVMITLAAYLRAAGSLLGVSFVY